MRQFECKMTYPMSPNLGNVHKKMNRKVWTLQLSSSLVVLKVTFVAPKSLRLLEIRLACSHPHQVTLGCIGFGSCNAVVYSSLHEVISFSDLLPLPRAHKTYTKVSKKPSPSSLIRTLDATLEWRNQKYLQVHS